MSQRQKNIGNDTLVGAVVVLALVINAGRGGNGLCSTIASLGIYCRPFYSVVPASCLIYGAEGRRR